MDGCGGLRFAFVHDCIIDYYLLFALDEAGKGAWLFEVLGGLLFFWFGHFDDVTMRSLV